MSATALKIIAVICMTLDHLSTYLGAPLPLRESLLQYNFQCFMILALPLLLLYNGKRGKGHKNFFYVYYPAHIYVLYIISNFLPA